MSKQDLEADIVAETDHFGVWRSEDEEEGLLFHIELGAITLHLTSEEWDEFVFLIKSTQA